MMHFSAIVLVNGILLRNKLDASSFGRFALLMLGMDLDCFAHGMTMTTFDNEQ